MYAWFSKASVCTAARDSGVSLGTVRIGFQLWPDRRTASASNVNVQGTFDCR